MTVPYKGDNIPEKGLTVHIQHYTDFLIPAENALALFGVSQARELTMGRFGWLP
ncbi:MAG: hypothetical protein ABIF71_05195 [Planctomycetota bacterium]